MSVNQVGTPAEMRAQETAAAALFARSSVGRADAGDANSAVACQWVSDVHRVSAALWNRAGTAEDPYQEFFALAEQVLTSADRVGVEEGITAAVLVADLRAAFARACVAMNLPLVFPPAPHLAHFTGAMDLSALRGQILGAMQPEEFVSARISAGTGFDGEVNALRFALDAYVVDVAARTGDHMMLTAVARIIALNDSAPRSTATLPELVSAARAVLGPVEWVRLLPYLAQVGVRVE